MQINLSRRDSRQASRVTTDPNHFHYADGAQPDGTAGFVLRRRTVLKGLLAGIGAGLAGSRLMAAERGSAASGPSAAPRDSNAPTWDTLAAVQATLFPSEPNAPGAKDVNALGYLRGVLGQADTDPAERKFLLAGLQWVDGTARQRDGQALADMDSARQEALLQQMAQSKDGENWLALVLYYVLEALLTDPVYGGNTDAVGWKWLHYIPGFPRPPVGKRYFELMGR